MHSFKLRVYYEDTDAGGIVYHANYLKFAERARTEFIRDMGMTNAQLRDEDGILVVVRHIDIDYSAMAFLEDELDVISTVEGIGNTSFLMKQVVQKQGHACATLLVKLVCIDSDTGRPVRIPNRLKDIL